MAFCSSCGAELQGRFCAQCGASAQGPASSPFSSAAGSAGLQENLAAALCYLLGVLTGVLFLVLEPYNRNRNIRFHAFQSIFAWIGVVVVSVVLEIVTQIFGRLPFVGWMISATLWTGFGLGIFVLWVVLMYKAYSNERWVLPFVGPLAEKQL
jgi:uncharacterized membrane protein